jgi:hypothetical protein
MVVPIGWKPSGTMPWAAARSLRPVQDLDIISSQEALRLLPYLISETDSRTPPRLAGAVLAYVAAGLGHLGVRAWLRVLALPLPPPGPVPGPLLASDQRPADDLSPPMPLVLSRTVLTAAPPARVPGPAGAAG